MKKTLVLVVGLLFGFTVHAQSDLLSSKQKLAATAKVWGFLKYYHPAVAQGKFDWDLELIDLLKELEGPMTANSFSVSMNQWIDSLGPVPECKKCRKASQQEYFNKNFDLSWMDDKRVFHTSLSARLRNIENNRFIGENNYAQPYRKNVGNFSPLNEEFEAFDWSVKEHRLLFVFKYWNMVEYFFPYKYQTDTPWSEVLVEAIEDVEYCQTEEDFKKALTRLIVKIDDGHGFVNFNTPRANWIPNRIEPVEDQMVVVRPWGDSIAQFSPLQNGDVVLAINGESISELKEHNLPLIAGSNLLSKQRNMGYLFGQTFGEENLNYRVRRNGEELDLEVPIYASSDFDRPVPKEKWKILENNIGFINMGIITPKEVFGAMKELKDTDGLIIDVRNYPKGSMYALSGRLVHKKKEFCKIIRPDYTYPGKFYWDEGLTTGFKKRRNPYTQPIVLLVNEQTQSHAEFSVMSLQVAENVTTIGRQTAGADGNICRIDLGKGYQTAFSGIGIFYPDRSLTQRTGVHIDQVVERTIEGVKQGKDEVLEAAMALFKNK